MFPATRRNFLLGASLTAASAPMAMAESRLNKLRPAAAPSVVTPRRLNLYNANTKETFDREYHDGTTLSERAREELDWFLRDHHENVSTRMDTALFDLLWGFQQRLARAGFGRGPLWIGSAYRTEKTNEKLRKEGAAHNSKHLTGQAVDITIPGHGVFNYERIAEWSATGGLGLYYWDHFVHFDTGPRRYWSQSR